MKRLHCLLLPLYLTLAAAMAEDITTTDGRTYAAATITKVEPDGLRIVHESGAAKIPFEKLPADLQQKHGYDPAKAAEFKKTDAAAQAAREAAMDREMAAQTAARKQAAGKQQALEKKAFTKAFSIASVADDGLLVNEVILHTRNIGGNSNGNGGTPAFRTFRTLSAASYFIIGYPGATAMAEDKIITGKFAEVGTYTFDDQDGISRTVTKYQFVSAK